MSPNDPSDWCPMCGPGAAHTAHGHCAHCGSQLVLPSVLQKLYDQAAHEFAVAVRMERRGMADDQPKIATGGNCERTFMASLTTPAATPEECECYASGVVLGVMTSASPLVVASLLAALREAWMARERTAWIAALQWVLACDPSRRESCAGVCVHGIGYSRPCLACREDVIRRKIAEVEDRKP